MTKRAKTNVAKDGCNLTEPVVVDFSIAADKMRSFASWTIRHKFSGMYRENIYVHVSMLHS